MEFGYLVNDCRTDQLSGDRGHASFSMLILIKENDIFTEPKFYDRFSAIAIVIAENELVGCR